MYTDNKPMYSAEEIASNILYLIQTDPLSNLKDDKETKKEINLKLHKLLYYAQALSITLYQEILFKEKITHNIKGPFCNDVYISIPEESILTPKMQTIHSQSSIGKLLLFTYRQYSIFTANQLVEKTHNEDPYLLTKQGDEISAVLIKREFEKPKYHFLAVEFSGINSFTMNSDYNVLENFFEKKDAFPLLYCAPAIHEGLMQAAKKESARAYYHLSACFEIYEEFDIKLKYPSRKLRQKAMELGADDLVLQSFEVPLDGRKKILESKVYEDAKSEGERLYHLAFNLKESEVDYYLQKSLEKGYFHAEVELARRKKSEEEAFETYLSAGNHGVPDGYFYAAAMIERGLIANAEKFKVNELWEKAFLLGQIQSGENLIQWYLENNNMDEQERIAKAEKIAANMPNSSMSGFVTIGNYYETKKDFKNAKIYYEKAGPFYGYYRAADLEENKKARNKLNNDAHLLVLQHFKSIVQQLHL